jgi:dipeptidyl aminopeptidase/acylaminoacyl peptidase
MSKLASVVLVTACLALGTVSCGDDDGTGVEGTGSIEVTLNMTGSDLDPDGCRVVVDGRVGRAIEAGGRVTFADLEAGVHGVWLQEVSGNCVVSGENPRTVSVAAGQTSETAFEVTCAALTGSLQVLTITTGDTLDADGYTVTVDGVTSQNMGQYETLTFSDLAAGSHSVELGDVAVNCGVNVSNPRTVSVGAGLTTLAVYPVCCRAALFERIAFDRSGAIYVMDADGSNPVNLTDHAAGAWYPVVSPDGTRIAFLSSRDGSVDIYVMDADGSNPVNLTNNPAWDAEPTWSPDGTRIAFTSDRDGEPDIYVMDADGSNAVRLTTNPLRYSPAWSPDGTRIAFTSRVDFDYEIYVMNADGSNPVNLTNDPARDEEPAWSPDGTRIAFWSERDGNQDIYVMDADGSNLVRLTNHPAMDSWPAWSPDGTRITFMSNRSGTPNIWVMGADGSEQVNLTNHWATEFYSAWSPGSEQR